ncbi:MAG: type II secretion system protein [Phycisphaerales bacterium]|nr:type II secretion system protein [Phycisphaerales bacterium]
MLFPMSRFLSSSSRRAFTLIELLVVIGVITTLLAIMLPSLSAVRREAESAACASQLRQLFVGLESYRRLTRDLIPICDFLPAATPAGPVGGLPALLDGFIDIDCKCWRCPADMDEDESLSTGTSYFYVPGLLRYSPQIQMQAAQLAFLLSQDATMSARLRERRRVEAEGKLVTSFYISNPRAFALITDSQDRHKIGDRVPRNGVYLDGSVRAVEIEPDVAQD